jgi:hypothetical protein
VTEGERIAERLRQLQEEGGLEAALTSSPNQGEEPSWMETARSAVRQAAGGVLFPPGRLAKTVLDYAEKNDVGLVGRTGIGAMQGASMGGLARLASAGETIDQALQGNFLSGEERAANRERYRDVVEENSNLGGELAGAILSGGAVFRGAAKAAEAGVPRLFNYLNRTLAGRSAATAGMSALEAAAYTLNEGGSLDDAQISAVYGAGFGVAGTAVGHLIGPVFAKMQATFGLKPDRTTATEILDGIRRSVGDDALRVGPRGEQLIDETYILNQAARFGDDATLIDIVPDAVVNQVHKLLTSNNPKVYDASIPLVRMLQNRQQAAQPEFRQAIRQIIDTDNYRTHAQVLADTKEAMSQISAVYDDVLNRATNNGVTFRADDMLKIVDRAFAANTTPPVTQVRDHLKALIGSPTVTVGSGRNAKQVPRELSPREAHSIREAFDNAIYSGQINAIGNRQTISSLENSTRTQYMQPARDGIKQMLHLRIPGMAEADAAFSTEAVNRAAYEAGERLFRLSTPDRAAFEIFVNDANKTPMQLEHFLEGVKMSLFRKLEGKNSPRAIQNVLDENRSAFDALAVVLEPQQIEALRTAISRYAAAVNTGNMIKPPPAPYDPDKSVLGSLTDAFLIAAGLTGAASRAGMYGGVRRTATGQLQPPGSQSRPEAISNALSAPAGDAVMNINRELSNALPTLMRYYPNFVGAYAGAAANME